ncbi:MAG TPA: DUF3177 family protein [Leptolyngbyaceae cyanobacterium]
MQDPWFKPLVWMDYKLALLFTLIIPLILLIWAFVGKMEAIQRLLIIYWRVASLLAITIYLMIAAIPISFISGILARILIPISVWFWTDINEEINDLPARPLKLALTSWRWAISVYCTLSAIAQIPFLGCAISARQAVLENPSCRVWLDPPWAYKLLFHPQPGNQGFLGFLGVVGLIIYVAYFGYFLFVRLAKEGRTAIEQ